MEWRPTSRRTAEGQIVATRRSDDQPYDELSTWLDKLTDELPEDVKAIILLDVPMQDGVLGSMVAHGFEDDEDILTSWRRHLSGFHAARESQ